MIGNDPKKKKEITDISIQQNPYMSEQQKKEKLETCHKLIQYTRAGLIDGIIKSLQDGAAIDYKSSGYSALGIACFYGRSEIVKWLIEHAKPDIEIPSTANDLTPLGIAIQRGSVETVKVLLNYGALATSKDKDGKTLFQYAVQSSNLDIVKLLFETDSIDLDQRNESDGSMILHDAACSTPQIVDYLLSVGATLESRTTNGRTVLHKAIVLKNLPLIKYLCTKPTLIDSQDKNDYSPLHLAVFYGSYEIVKILLENNASKDLIESSGKTALDMAKSRRLNQIVHLLETNDIDENNSGENNSGSSNEYNGTKAMLELFQNSKLTNSRVKKEPVATKIKEKKENKTKRKSTRKQKEQTESGNDGEKADEAENITLENGEEIETIIEPPKPISRVALKRGARRSIVRKEEEENIIVEDGEEIETIFTIKPTRSTKGTPTKRKEKNTKTTESSRKGNYKNFEIDDSFYSNNDEQIVYSEIENETTSGSEKEKEQEQEQEREQQVRSSRGRRISKIESILTPSNENTSSRSRRSRIIKENENEKEEIAEQNQVEEEEKEDSSYGSNRLRRLQNQRYNMDIKSGDDDNNTEEEESGPIVEKKKRGRKSKKESENDNIYKDNYDSEEKNKISTITSMRRRVKTKRKVRYQDIYISDQEKSDQDDDGGDENGDENDDAKRKTTKMLSNNINNTSSIFERKKPTREEEEALSIFRISKPLTTTANNNTVPKSKGRPRKQIKSADESFDESDSNKQLNSGSIRPQRSTRSQFK